MSGEFFPTFIEWTLWFTHKKEVAIQAYMNRPKYTMMSLSKNKVGDQGFREIHDGAKYTEVFRRFLALEKEGRMHYRLYLLEKYDNLLQKLELQ